MTGSSQAAVSRAYARCIDLARAHYENFPVASCLIPKALRKHVCAVYAFARIADDYADEPGMDTEERLERLDAWLDNLRKRGVSVEDDIFLAVEDTIRKHDLPIALFEDLLSAFRQDVVQPRHDRFEDLLDYATRSANPVGRLLLLLFGYRDDALMTQSDAICTGLQLTNFWQDVGVDYGRGRIYIPQSHLASYGVEERDLGQTETSAFVDMLADLVAKTRCRFREGLALPEQVRGRFRYELRLTCLGGLDILRQIETSGYRVLSDRPTVSRTRAISLLFRALTPVRVT